MKEINIENWKRKEHYNFFSRMDYPHFNICFDVDITDLLSYIKKNDLPFYYTMIYISTVSANQIEEFKYRSRDGKIILHDIINPAFTDMDKDSDLFRMVAVNMNEDIRAFISTAKNKSMNQREYFIASDFINRDDYIYITSIPWISFTHISHTISLNKNDSVPRISWGKYYEKNSRFILPFSVQVNHAFVDGIHIGKYKDILEKKMSEVIVL